MKKLFRKPEPEPVMGRQGRPIFDELIDQLPWPIDLSTPEFAWPENTVSA